jgi:hypothetical protein
MQPPTKNMYLLLFTKEVLDMVARHEMYSFFDEFPNYHHIMIALEDKYKIAFIMEWGEFV